MEIIKILRKNMPIFVRRMMVGELDITKCSTKFLSHNLNDNVIVNVKCYENGTFDLRGKKEEYRIIVPDNKNLTEKNIVDDHVLAMTDRFIEWKENLHNEIMGGKLMFDVPEHYKWLDEKELLTYYIDFIYYQ
jgi:hypothetical protein